MDTKQDVENVMKQRFFVTPTEYPPQNGFLDYGPALTQVKQQILQEFRKIFLDEFTYEIEPSIILPRDVLKNSGHLDRFCDIVITDGESNFRADHFLEDTIGSTLRIPSNLHENYAILLERVHSLKLQILGRKGSKSKERFSMKEVADKLAEALPASTEQFSSAEVDEILSEFECSEKHASELSREEIDFIVILHNLHSPAHKPFNPSKNHNLIFKVSDSQYMRPELAQSQFVNFRRLYDLNYERLPFSSFCVGRSYRNEISARGGMLRTKEFEQAEIEYFSEDGQHSGFHDIRNISVVLLPAGHSSSSEMTINEAWKSSIIRSEAICYFIAKAQEFLLRIGFSKEVLRFRQHNKSEMAHYASDCWDAEVRTHSGWVECAGIADRGTFDLTCHSGTINTQARKVVPLYTIYEPIIDRKALGKQLRGKAKDLEEYVLSLNQAEIAERREEGGNAIQIEFEGKEYTFLLEEKRVDYKHFIPRVIEPSFGISRILYALVEQGFMVRDERIVLRLKPFMCYLHCVIGYLKYMDGFAPLLSVIKKDLSSRGIRFRTNERNCSIGRKYSSADEIGVPYFIIFDFETMSTETVTIRERDSTSQIRVAISVVPTIIEELVSEKKTWNDYFELYGINK